MRLAAALLSSLVLGCALGALPAAALADDAGAPAQPARDVVKTEVLMLHGTNDGTGIDPKIGKMHELGAPPFSSYNSYKQLDRVTLTLSKGSASTTKLPNGRVLMVTFKEVLSPKVKGEPKKYALDASIESPVGKTFLPLVEVNAKADVWVVIAGQSYKGGMLAIGIKVLP